MQLLKCSVLAVIAFVFTSLLGTAQPFAPLSYSPTIKQLDIDGDKCGLQLFVAPNGNDAWSGKKAVASAPDGPFATLEHARDFVRKLISSKKLPKGGVAINLLEGNYLLSKSFELTADDSGQDDAPIVYRNYKQASVHLFGGKILSAKDFTPVTDPGLVSRLDVSAKNKVVQLNTKALGFTHTDLFPDVFSDGGGIFELFVNDKRMPISRWPDDTCTTMKEVVEVGNKTTPGSFIYRDERVERWGAAKDIWLKGFWRVGWENPAIKVANIDKDNKQITFKVGLPLGIGNKYNRPKGNGKEEWYALNLVEEITREGEWSIDFATGMLYWWPPSNFATESIIASQLEKPMVIAKDLRNTAFIGITFEGALGDGMSISKGNQNLVAGCTFKNLGGNGIVLNGEKNGIQSCDMYGLGKGCIIVSGGNREQLTESGNYVINNHLHHYGVLKSQYSAAVDLYSENSGAPAVGILVSHNLIHHAPRDGVLFGGNKIVFEYNEIHRCGYSTADVGAFYSWMDWTIRGVVIRYNFIHHTVGGVNPDDGASGTFVYGNIFAGNRTGVWIASGPDHQVFNNIFIKNDGPVFGMDDRGKGRGYATNKNLLKKVNSINPASPPWSTTFPEMATLLDNHPELPQRTKFTGNLIWIKKGNPTLIKIGKELAKDTNIIAIDNNLLTDKDPGFVDAANNRFQLKPNAPVWEKIPNFPKIDSDKMGLYPDKYRKKLPTPEEAGRLPEQNPWKNGDTDLNFGT